MGNCIDCCKKTCRKEYVRCRKCSDIFRCGTNHSGYKHGLAHKRFNIIYKNIKSRCSNPLKNDFKNYGGRGIKCLWNTFDDFTKDMLDSYYFSCKKNGEKNTTIERVNYDGDYCRENCIWATPKEQGRNKRNNRLITLNKITLCVSEWGEKIGIPGKIIRQRIDRDNWSIKKALTTPVKHT